MAKYLFAMLLLTSACSSPIAPESVPQPVSLSAESTPIRLSISSWSWLSEERAIEITNDYARDIGALPPGARIADADLHVIKSRVNGPPYREDLLLTALAALAIERGLIAAPIGQLFVAASVASTFVGMVPWQCTPSDTVICNVTVGMPINYDVRFITYTVPSYVTIIRCSWDFGDGHRVDGCGNVRHRYAAIGVYHPRVEVIAADGRRASNSIDAQMIVGF